MYRAQINIKIIGTVEHAIILVRDGILRGFMEFRNYIYRKLYRHFKIRCIAHIFQTDVSSTSTQKKYVRISLISLLFNTK